jgi:transposase
MAAMETWLAEDTRRRSELIALRSVPGIGKVLGLTILLESSQIARFDAVGQYTSYCRLVPALRFSNGKIERGRQPQVRQSLSRLGLDGGGQLRDPLRARHPAVVPAQCRQETALGRAQGRGAQVGACRLLLAA